MAVAMVGALAALAATTQANADPGDPGEPVVVHDRLPPRTDFPRELNPGYPDVVIADEGNRVITTVGQLNRFTTDIFTTPIDGGRTTRLSLGNGRDAEGQVSPDGAWVVFRQLSLETGGRTLYAAPAAGGDRVLLWDPTDRFDVNSFKISPDSSTVYFVAEQRLEPQGSLVRQLYSVPIAGGEPVIVVGGAGLSSTVFHVSPDGAVLLVNLRDLRPGGDSLGFHVIPAAGGDAVPLDLPPGHIRFGPDSSVVAVRTHRGPQRLFVAPIDGTARLEVTAPLPTDGHTAFYEFSPDGTRIVYLADQVVDERFELYSVDVDTGERTRLNTRLPAGGDVTWFDISDDGQHVVFRADQRRNNVHELFSVPTAGGPPTRLNSPLPPGGDVKPSRTNRQIEISPDSAWVFYVADQDRNNRRELYRVPISGGSPTRATPRLERWSDVRSFTLSPSGEQVAFIADLDTNGVGDLYVTNVGGGDVRRLSGPMAAGGDVKPLVEWTPDESHVVFVADARTNNQRELFSVRVAA